MSNRQPLEVVDGMRGAITLQEPPKSAQPAYPAAQFDLPPGTVEYRSMTGGLWLVLSEAHKLRDPDSGYEHVTPGLSIQFAQGVARTADPEKIHRIEGCAAKCELHPRGLPAHPGFGIGKTLWRADAARALAAQKQENSDIERLKNDPAAARRLLEQLQAAGFDVAPRPSQDKKPRSDAVPAE